jgi:hypothetical protein
MDKIMELLPENERKICVAMQINVMMDKDKLTIEKAIKRYFEIKQLTL